LAKLLVKEVFMKLLQLGLTVFTLTLGMMVFAQHDMKDMGNKNGMREMPMSMSSNTMLEGLQGADLETAFLSMMIEHHKGAIEMANWILERTQNADIKAAAKAIVAAQDPEIKQMAQWLQDWYSQGIDQQSAIMMQGEMTMMMQAMEADVNSEIGFLEQMSLHHNSAINMAQSALLGATHPELRELAKNIIVTQAREIAQYQDWLEVLAPTSQSEPSQDMHAQHGTMSHGTMSHDTNTTSAYLDQLASSVRGLSQEEINGLLAGKGLGYARSAELNGYPGPRHVLDMTELQLTSEQTASITTIFDNMNREAVTLGQKIVDAETVLSQSFSDKKITEVSLQEQLKKLTALYSQLRQVHLQAHLAVTPLLSEDQLAQYQVLRGYTQN
jgi:uncharacterized protein (DUF305 family)